MLHAECPARDGIAGWGRCLLLQLPGCGAALYFLHATCHPTPTSEISLEKPMSEFYVVKCSEARMKTHPIKWTSCVHGEIAHLSLQKVHWLSSLFVCPAMVTQSATLSYFPLYKSYNHTGNFVSPSWLWFPVFPKPVFQKLPRRKFIFLLQTFSSTPSLFFFSSTKKHIFLNQIFSSLLFRFLCKKYTFLLQIFSFFSFPVFLLICKKYVFLLQIFKCQTFLCQPEMSTVIRRIE